MCVCVHVHVFVRACFRFFFMCHLSLVCLYVFACFLVSTYGARCLDSLMGPPAEIV